MHSSSRKPLALLALAALCCSVAAPLAARAEGEGGKPAAAGVGVARISYIQGPVAVQRGDAATPSAAVINAPVLGADYVTTGENARAEIQFDGTTMVRLGANVQMRFTHLDTGDRELQLAEGTVELRLLRGVGGRTQIDTPSVSVRPRAGGAYRVGVGTDGKTQVTVRSGSAEVVTPQETRALGSGTTLLAQGAAARPVLQDADALAYDDFDTFNTARDERELRALADASYVAPGVSGVDDLTAYGRWVSDTDYGHVWVPSHVAPDWAPYRDGRWAWEENVGWTWIGYEPWGWAPYHYGRWYHHARHGWCWYPDPFVVAWRPALVGFFTFGTASIGFGNIAWVPLSPLEPFNPWWGRGFGSTTIVNNVTNVTNNYYNTGNGSYTQYPTIAKFFGNAKYNGVTYVPARSFQHGHFEHRLIGPPQLHDVHIVRGAVPLVPTADNLRYSEHPVAAQLAVRAVPAQREFAGNALIAQRTPFERQRAEIASAAHLTAAPERALAAPRMPPAAPRMPLTTTVAPATARTAVTATPVQATTVNDPWARFGASRGIPAGVRTTPSGVTVIDGAKTSGASAATSRPNAAGAPRTANDPQAWSRFDASAPRSAPSRQMNRASDAAQPSAASARTEPVRTYSAPARTYEAAPQPQRYAPPQQAQPQRYAAPPQQPAPPQQQQQRNAPPPARTTTTSPRSATPH